ncbi:MAG TPA: heme lyase CcmF/NrfE family subunit [Burkholderiales bacterium]|nr:heme lyase CcmF/NrfE family subunit [Burkholderiales bacterium]
MIPEIGQFALSLALAVALAQSILPLVGAARGIPGWIALARPAAQVQFALLALAFVCLTYAFVTNDFSVAYVAMHSNSTLPLVYRMASVWGGHRGSMLLWTLLLGAWMVAVTLFSAHLPEEMVARVLGVMGIVSAGFLAFIVFTSDPFARLFPVPPNGQDLNPLLQDPGMVVHPPMLYMGYVGFSVAFAFAIAALLSGRLDAAWARWSRPWTLAAWMFLTLGIALGSAWSYYVLGWGGWWFWDPVENASFMPWLAGTALIHSLAVTEKRGSFRSWTVLLAICAFALSLLGTFLVRSGILTSVHAFAVDPRRGVFILILFAALVGSSLLLFAVRTARIGLGGSFAVVSRESSLLANNVLLSVAAASVLLGTLYPLALDALGAGKISVGPPYFDAVFVPLMAPAVFLMGVGPLARWKRASLPELAVLLRWALAVSVLCGALLPLLLGRWSPLIGLGLALAAWVVASSVVTLRDRVRHAGSAAGAWARLRSTPRSWYGMMIAHLGIAVFIAGVTVVKGYETQKDVRMQAGDTVELSGYTFRLIGVSKVQGPNYTATQAQMQITRHGRTVTTLYPQRRVYTVQHMPTINAAIDEGLMRHLYVTLGDPLNATTWVVRVQYKPLVSWIWLGCLVMALGGLLSATDRRYRVAATMRRAASSEVAVTQAGAAR